MSVKVRISIVGKKNAPAYRIIAIDSRKKRDGEALDIIGAYDPLKGKIITFDAAKLESWKSKGAVITDAVKKIQRQFKHEQPVQ